MKAQKDLIYRKSGITTSLQTPIYIVLLKQIGDPIKIGTTNYCLNSWDAESRIGNEKRFYLKTRYDAGCWLLNRWEAFKSPSRNSTYIPSESVLRTL